MNDAPVSGPIALVVEDDAATRYLLSHILQKEGYCVKAIDDGRAAERLIEHGPAPALVTLDCLLPHVDGFDLLETIQRQPRWNKVPVLMLSTNSQQRWIARALDAGADAYLVKPFRLGELRATVQRLAGAGDPVMAPAPPFVHPYAADGRRPAARMALGA